MKTKHLKIITNLMNQNWANFHSICRSSGCTPDTIRQAVSEQIKENKLQAKLDFSKLSFISFSCYDQFFKSRPVIGEVIRVGHINKKVKFIEVGGFWVEIVKESEV